MGAVTALMHSDRDPSIAGIVCDSAFSDLKQLATELGRKYTKMPGFVLSMGMKFVAKSVKGKANFDLNKVSPINHVDKAFIPALFGHAVDDDFILPSHTENLHEKYSGDKNHITFEGDHNSPRPQFFMDSVAIFFINSLRVNDIVPKSMKITPKEPESSLPEFDEDDGDFFGGHDYNGYGNDVTEDDLIRMAMEESMKTHAEEQKTPSNDDVDPEQAYLAQAFSLDKK